MKLSEAVTRTMELGRKISNYYEGELPKVHPNYPLVGPDDKSVAPPPEEKELESFLSALPEDLFYRLMLIMYLGREDFRIDKMSDYFEKLYGSFGEPSQAAPQMMHRASLADYFEYALEELQKHKINIDKLPLKKTKSRKS